MRKGRRNRMSQPRRRKRKESRRSLPNIPSLLEFSAVAASHCKNQNQNENTNENQHQSQAPSKRPSGDTIQQRQRKIWKFICIIIWEGLFNRPC
eukprot:11589_1